MKKSNIFQIILLVVFGFFIIVAVVLFSVKGGGSGEVFLGDVTIWGTLPKAKISKNIKNIYGNDKTVNMKYVEKDKSVFEKTLIEALASGTGPDIALLPQDLVLRHSDKTYPIPYESMSARNFKDRFIEEGEVYLSKDGIFALPFIIDPMVMYWNRDLFSSAGISKPPSFWDEFYTIAPLMTRLDNDSNIIKSTISFGEFKNVTHAKDIISLLIMQAGDPIIIEDPLSVNAYRTVLSERFDYDIAPADSALRFYTEFSNPSKESYSWNRALPSSRNMFAAGNLAVYFGYASELSEIQRKNPHLNFDVASMPQTRDAVKKMTFGRMDGLAIMKSSKNISGAFRAVTLLSDAKFISALSEEFSLPPVRRDLLTKKPSDAFKFLFYDSAIVSRAWLDPSPDETEIIFQKMVGRIVSREAKISEAVSLANGEMERLLSKLKKTE